jgi:hypothetical protein
VRKYLTRVLFAADSFRLTQEDEHDKHDTDSLVDTEYAMAGQAREEYRYQAA